MRPRGHPKTGGRAKGVLNRATADVRSRIQEQADPIGFLISVSRGELISGAVMKDSKECLEAVPTLDQRMHAASLLARKITPDAKDSPIRLALPPITAAVDVLAALDVVAAAMARGEITPSEAQIVAGVLDAKRKAIETVEIEERLAALERAKEQSS